MAGKSVDELLDGGTGCLDYFSRMLALAKRISSRTWPSYKSDILPAYDRERGIDLEAVRGDAAMLRAQAASLRQQVTDQHSARERVDAAWPDTAGRTAVSTLTAYEERSEPTAEAVEATATAAEAIDDAVIKAVQAKVSGLSEFGQVTDLDDLRQPLGGLSEQAVRLFELVLQRDLARFGRVVEETSAAVRAAYAAVPDAAKADAAPFPAPSFGAITGPTVASPSDPATAPVAPVAPITSGGGGSGDGSGGGSGGGGGPAATSPTSSAPRAASPTSAAPAATSPATTDPATTAPVTSSGGASPSAGTSGPASATPAAATPAATSGAGAPSSTGAGVPSWLSQLLPKLTEQLGLGNAADKSGGAGGDSDPDGAKDDAEDDAKDGRDKEDGASEREDRPGTRVLGVDALGRTVTATVGPDGRTVEVSVRRPDGTEQKLTLQVGADGALRPATGDAGTEPTGPGTGAKASTTPVPSPAPAPTTPSPTTPSPTTPAAPAPAPAPVVGPERSPGQPVEPCPPEGRTGEEGAGQQPDAGQGDAGRSGAELAVTLP